MKWLIQCGVGAFLLQVAPALGWWAAPLGTVRSQPRAAEALQALLRDPGEPGPLPGSEVLAAELGTFLLLTYNTAGLPPIINGLNDIRHFDIGWRLNGYDLVLVQEDFFYHDRLTHFVGHPYPSPITFYHAWWHLLLRGRLAPDGLHRFSSAPYPWVERYPWAACHGAFEAGFDCLALKGFSVATHWMAPGAAIDVYNLHMDAGGAPGDVEARMVGLEQIRVRMEQRAGLGVPSIVAGDWNARWSDPEDVALLTYAREGLGLTDVSAAVAGEGDFLHQIDRILYRNGDLVLAPVWYRNDAPGFLDWAGRDLSDHPPIAVLFAYARPVGEAIETEWHSATRLGGNLWWLVTASGLDYLAVRDP